MTTQTIIVPDSSPLITLAAAKSLDALLKPGLPVKIPDGVFWEATRHVEMLGARALIDWMAANEGAVQVSVTHEHAGRRAEIEASVTRIKDHGERCALEVVERLAEQNPSNQSIFIYEDGDVTLLAIVNTDKIAVVTTASFLDALEREHLIQSADHILDEAVAEGRNQKIRIRNAMHAQILQQRGGIGR